MKWFVLAVAAAMYAAVIVQPQRKSLFTLAAAVAVIAAGAVGFGHAAGVLINWNILMIYLGSLVIAELFIYSRVPAYIADKIVEKTPNHGVAIVLILMMTGLISAFVENVATVLVMAPIAFALSSKLRIAPTYFIVGLAVMANLQGTATLVGDPPSMIFASYSGYSFNDFFVFHGRPSIFFCVQIGMLAGGLFFYNFFKGHKGGKIDLGTERIVSFFPTILLILMVAGLAVISFFHSGVSLTAGIFVLALAAIGIAWYVFVMKEGASKTAELVKSLDWDTMAFLVGIFVVIGAVTETGLIDDFANLLSAVIGNNILLGFLAVLAVSVVISGFVDNVPYIIAMLPVSAKLSSGLHLNPELYMFALLIGSCLGGNLTPFGASANIVAVGMLRKKDIHMGFADWLKIGVPFTAITTAAAAASVWLFWR